MASIRELQQQLIQSHEYIRQLNQEVQTVKNEAANMVAKLNYLDGGYNNQADPAVASSECATISDGQCGRWTRRTSATSVVDRHFGQPEDHGA